MSDSDTTIPDLPSKKVPYVYLGKSGMKVSRVILGCMTYGGGEWMGWLWLLGEAQAIEHIKYAYDCGTQTFGTAPVYSNGLSEVILGKAIRQLGLPRDEIVVMTKFGGLVLREGGPGVIRDMDVADSSDFSSKVEEIAAKRGISMAQVALTWETSKSVVAAPIIGTTNLHNLKDIVESIDLKLTEEEIKYLEEPYRPMKIIGH